MKRLQKIAGGRMRLVIGTIILFFTAALTVVAATTWKGPDNPPTDVSNLDSVTDFSDFVSKSKLEQQRLNGPLQVFNSGNYPVFSGYQNVGLNIGVMGGGKTGFAANEVPPLPASGNYGVYGFADTGASNFGLYGVSASGVGVAGKVSVVGATDYAGFFNGPVRIEDSETGVVAGSLQSGNLQVEKSLTANGGFTANQLFGPAVQVQVTGSRSNTRGIYAFTSGGPANIAGVLGYSISNFGVLVSGLNERQAAYGRSDTVYGVYGYGTNGDAVIGVADPVQGHLGVYGESLDYGVYGYSKFTVSGNEYAPGASLGTATSTETGVGILACGTRYAGEFTGDVRIIGSLQMGIGLEKYIEKNDTSDTIVGKAIYTEVLLTEPMLQSVASQAGVTLTTLP